MSKRFQKRAAVMKVRAKRVFKAAPKKQPFKIVSIGQKYTFRVTKCTWRAGTAIRGKPPKNFIFFNSIGPRPVAGDLIKAKVTYNENGYAELGHVQVIEEEED